MLNEKRNRYVYNVCLYLTYGMYVIGFLFLVYGITFSSHTGADIVIFFLYMLTGLVGKIFIDYVCLEV